MLLYKMLNPVPFFYGTGFNILYSRFKYGFY